MIIRHRGGRLRRAVVEVLENRTLLAFGLTTSTSTYTVDTGAGLVFSVARTTANSAAVGDLTSTVFNGTQFEAPHSQTNRYSHYESGLSSAAVVSAATDPGGQWIEIACDDTGATGVGVIQYYIARKGFSNIYMATYSPGPNSPSPGEMRFIMYTNPAVLTNIPAPSNNNGNTGAIESSDVFGHADGTTTSKYFGEYRAIDAQTYGMTGSGAGIFMNIGNRETSSGGPFYKDIDFQSNELYTYTFSGHSQTENFRAGLKGPYALQFTTGAMPAAPDYSFIEGIGLTGYVPSAQRGMISGVASGVPGGLQSTVALSNATAQYWALPDASGNYAISGVIAGTYTETLYQGELAVGSVPVTINAGATSRQNIVNTNNYAELSSSSIATTTPVVANPVFRIGTWDATPIGFLNADKIANMHPTDVRMSPWAADATGLTNFTVGTDPDSSFPMAEWHTQTAAAPFVDTDNRITFSLTSTQAATLESLRIGVTRLQQGRPNITVNSSWTSSTQSLSSQPSSRGLTTGNWRGNNTVYIFNIPSGTLHSGTNTIDISCVSGSTGTLYSGYHIYDAIDLVPTSALTNASVVKTITVTPANPAVNTNAHQQFTATAKDQSGNVIPANFAWSDTRGTVDGTGLYTAPATTGSDTVSATSGSVSGSTNVTVTPPLQVSSGAFQYLTRQALVFAFNKTISPSLLASALVVVNQTTGVTVPSSAINVNYSNPTATMTFTSELADGNYTATIAASSALTSAGEHLASDYVLNFFTLMGDTNHDGKVDVTDLGNLASSYGLTSGANWAEGDFDYNGAVDVADLGDLASNYGSSLPTAPAASSAANTTLAASPAASVAHVEVATAPRASAAPPTAETMPTNLSSATTPSDGAGRIGSSLIAEIETIAKRIFSEQPVI